MKLSAMTLFEWKKINMSGKWSFPFVLLIIYLGFSYTFAPSGVLDSFALSAYVLFVLMISFGLIVDSIDSKMVDASILVKAGRKQSIFYQAKILSIGIYSLIGSVIAMLVPSLRYLISGTNFFLREFVISDIISGLVIHIFMGLAGGLFGLMMNGRIIARRSVAVILCTLFALTNIIKGSVNTDMPWTKLITWMLPPVYDLVDQYGGANYFYTGLMPIFLWMFLYIVFEIIVYVFAMKKLKYK